MKLGAMAFFILFGQIVRLYSTDLEEIIWANVLITFPSDDKTITLGRSEQLILLYKRNAVHVQSVSKAKVLIPK